MNRHDAPHVEWFTSWSPSIRSALDALPETDACDRDLDESLLARAISPARPVAVVYRREDPIAVVGLRKGGSSAWEPIPNWIIPGFIGAATSDDLLPSLVALHRDLLFAWWEMDTPVPTHPWVRTVGATMTHRLRTSERESFWRSSGHWKDIIQARKKCAGLDVRVNDPLDAAWIIESSERKWNPDDDRSWAIADRIMVANHMHDIGRQLTVVLTDGTTPLAGCTATVYHDTSEPGIHFRDNTVGNRPTGIRVFDAFFDAAEQRGIGFVDMGGGFDYKRKWAPPCGAHYRVRFTPPARHATLRVGRGSRSGARMIRDCARTITHRGHGSTPATKSGVGS